jgi:hypothetical protein
MMAAQVGSAASGLLDFLRGLDEINSRPEFWEADLGHFCPTAEASHLVLDSWPAS